MNRRNYAREFYQIAEKSQLLPSPYRNGRPTLLLHSCCGPCSSAVLETVVPYFSTTILWYNPNIYPEAEFSKRLNTQKELLKKSGLSGTVQLLETEWRAEEYYAAVKGLENAPEGGARCAACFRLRLTECAKTAERLGFDFFGTTLTVSRYKNTVLVNAVGEKTAADTRVAWLPSDFKKNNGENRSVFLAEQYGLYRQTYCGCEFSMRNGNGDRADCRKENQERNTDCGI